VTAESPPFVCPACRDWLYFSYTSDRTGNIRHGICRKKSCKSKWLAVWKGKPMKSCIGMPMNTRMADWSWVRADGPVAICCEEEL